MTMMKNDHEAPAHYNMKHEPIDVMREWGTDEEFIGFCKLNTIKYLSRMGKKDGNTALQDAKKARDYLNWMIESLEKFSETK